jgi:hypothetical protein
LGEVVAASTHCLHITSQGFNFHKYFHRSTKQIHNMENGFIDVIMRWGRRKKGRQRKDQQTIYKQQKVRAQREACFVEKS